ncbi:MAG: hypothetical protein ACYDA1_09845, partial [Vulcanimicrobiaceae bacterium]
MHYGRLVLGMSGNAHEFLSSVPDTGGERISAGYPDECSDFLSFGASLGALVTQGEFLLQPCTQKRLAIVVDFYSQTQAEAEASLEHGWNGALQFPTGNVNTIRSREETNEQNARIERHISFIATGDTMRDFYWNVIEKLLDGHSCDDSNCRICEGRFPRDLALALTVLADGLKLKSIYLFSQWEPSATLRETLGESGIALQWNPLLAIPKDD